MKQLMCSLIAICLFPFFLANANVLSQPFELKTLDQTTVLTGAVDIPVACEHIKCPAVLMVGGTGLFDRDYDFGNSNSGDDLLFKKLAASINSENIIVVRYDYRGVRCSMKTAPKCDSCKTEFEVYKAYYSHCVDPKVRSKVTPVNIREDIAAIYDFAVNHKNIEAGKVAVLAHSEGTLHTARLISNQRLKPAALVMLGMIAESPKEMMHWQSVDRNVDSIFKYDANKNRVLELDERARFCAADEILSARCSEILPEVREQDYATVTASMKKLFEEAVAMVMASPDSSAFPGAEMPMASMAWWKMFYTDTVRPIDQVVGFEGKISFSNGDIDTQTPGFREIRIVKENQTRFQQLPRIHLLRGIGHGFGPHGTFGPMSEESIGHILGEIRWALEL